MGKYLQMLDELYQPEEKNQISKEREVTKPTKALLSPFVSANSKDIQFFSDSKLPNTNSNKHEEKTVKASKRELTKPTKGIDGVKEAKPTDQEISEHLIGSLELHDDRVFVRRRLIGIYGEKRLDLVNQYFDEWQKGMDTEPVEIKKDNVGRKRANTWLRAKLENETR